MLSFVHQNTLTTILVSAVCFLAFWSNASEAFVCSSHQQDSIQRQVPNRVMTTITLDGSSSNGNDYVISYSSSRRSFFKDFMKSTGGITAAAAVTFVGLSRHPLPATAAYGEATNVVLPSYIDFLIEKNKVFDPSTALYKGADVQVQLERLKQASKRLEEIPILADQKKWSQIQSILTGPLGTLIQTMNQLTTDNKKARQQVAVVKNDLVTINQGAAKKSVDICIQGTKAAAKHLEDFLEIVFEK